MVAEQMQRRDGGMGVGLGGAQSSPAPSCESSTSNRGLSLRAAPSHGLVGYYRGVMNERWRTEGNVNIKGSSLGRFGWPD